MKRMNSREFLSLLASSAIITLLLAAVALPNYITSRERAKIARVRINMYAIQLAAEDFSTMADGLYPGGIRTTVNDLWPSNPNDRCIAGAERLPFPDNALISYIGFCNPFCYFFVSIRNGRIVKGISGCVFYCAYDQNDTIVGEGEAAMYYEIRGRGRRTPLDFLLTNREQE